MRHIRYSTNAKAEEETYVKFPKSFPEDLFPGFKAGTITQLKRKLYGSKSAPKLWYNCVYQYVIELHSCLFVRVTVVGGQVCAIANGIFVHGLLVAGNSVAEITEVRERMNQIFILSDEWKLFGS